MASSASALTSGKLWVRIGPNLPVRCFRSGLVFLRVAGRDPGRRTSVRVVVTEALRRLRGAGPRSRRHARTSADRSEEHTSELQSRGHLVCRLLLEKKKN